MANSRNYVASFFSKEKRDWLLFTPSSLRRGNIETRLKQLFLLFSFDQK